MKKVYEPLNMIKNGRYAVLYGKLAPEIQQQEHRVIKGWFPENPKRHDYYEALRLKRPR